MTRAFICIFIVLAMLMAGCTYSDSEYYYANPVPGDSATVSISTSLDTIDVAVITDSLMFRFSAEIQNGELYFASASIASLTIYQRQPDYNPDTLTGPYVLTDSFWIWSDLAADTAIYPLLLSIYYSSNTNSLGDRLGVEADILSLDFNLLLQGGEK